ncbi:MAG TPA: sugar phosphate nucleotidyltransferase [Rhabdochlamydiaceae bacterium]
MSLNNVCADKNAARELVSIILAGGQGTRLFPLTQTRCKPAVGFGGRYRLIDIPLSNSLNSRIDNIYVISQYFSSFLHQHIIETYPLDYTRDAKIHFISPEETFHRKAWYKGTADAIRQNLDHLMKTPADYFLILSGDQLYNMDYLEMLQFAKKMHADIVIAALPVEEHLARRMGVLKIDASDKVIEFYEKPQESELLKGLQFPKIALAGHALSRPDATHFLGSMGIYIFKREALFKLMQCEGDDFGRHLLPQEVKKGNTYAFVFRGYWEDIGTIGSFYEANLALTRRQNCINMYDEDYPIFTRPHNLPSPFIRDTHVRNSHISQGSVIEAQEIDNSIIGVRSCIKKGTVIRNSIVLGNLFYTPPRHQSPPLPENFSIGENCLLDKVIIDEHTQIGNNVRLVNQNRLDTYDGKGIYIRDGVIVVTTGTVLPDHFVL